MKKLSLTALMLVGIALASSAIAAQDQALIQTTRKNQLAHDARESKKGHPTTGAPKNLPIEHGSDAVASTFF